MNDDFIFILVVTPPLRIFLFFWNLRTRGQATSLKKITQKKIHKKSIKKTKISSLCLKEKEKKIYCNIVGAHQTLLLLHITQNIF